MTRDRFLEGMSHAASTVNVVTTAGSAGRAGVTVSAMCSVSADPPSLLVCVHHQSHAASVIRENGVLCVNVLRDAQSFIADTFAGRIEAPGGDKFACAEWRAGETGAPVLADALVAFDCRVGEHVRWGTHYIFVAEVLDIVLQESGPPLIYANRAYGKPVRFERLAAPGEPHSKPRERLDVACFVTLGPFFMPRLLRGFLHEHPQVDIHLHEGAQEALAGGLERGEYDLALAYDVGLGAALETRLLAEIPPHALLPAEHPLARKRTVSLAELAPEPMVLLDIAPSREYFRSLFAEVGLEPTVRLHSPSFETVRGLVANGFGYSLLVTKPANSMSYDGAALASRPLAEPVTPGRVVIAKVAGRPASGPVGAFAEYCEAFFGHRPPG